MKHDNTGVGRKASWLLAMGLVVFLFSPMLLGTSKAGVELAAMPAGVTTKPSDLPRCVSAHIYDSHGWGSFTTIRSDVRLIGCNAAAGRLRPAAGPICEATSVFGGGQATCTATPDGSDVKVVVHLKYPFGLNLLAGPPSTATFWISPSGSYHS